jgi:tripartite-type tricarboxylate transporter receptor subunit TctC
MEHVSSALLTRFTVFVRRALPVATGAVAILCAGASSAQEWPTKAVRLIVPFVPGGATDVVGRVFAEALTPRLGQQVFVDNKPGAGSTVGTAIAARAPADGYTLLVIASPGGFTNATELYKNPGFDPVKDFTAVSMVAAQPNLLVVHPSFKVTSVKEFVDYAKANPGKLTYATPGVGSSHHLAMEYFKQLSGIDIVHIPYKGGGQMTIDVVAGRVPVMFGTYVLVGPHLKSGKLKAIGTTSKDGLSQMPEVVPMTKQGYPDFDVWSWFGIAARTGTPEAILDRLAREAQIALKRPDVVAKMDKIGINPAPEMTRQSLEQKLHADIAKWTKLLRDVKIKPE